MGVIERFGVKFHPARVHYNAFSGLILSSELHCTKDLVEKLVKYLKTIFIWYFYVQLSYVLKKYFLLFFSKSAFSKNIKNIFLS